MIFVYALIIAGLSSAHPLHVAYTNIEINTEQKSVSVSHKIFTDDFTLLFFHLFEKNIIPNKAKEFNPAEVDMIDGYMKERFILVTGKDTIDLDYICKQQSDESLWLYFSGQIKNRKLSQITIHNLLLLDLYMDQTNLVIINNDTIERGLSFNWDNRQSVLVLKE